MQSNQLLRDLMRLDPTIGDELKPVHFVSGQRVADAGEPISSVIFPDTGLLIRIVPFEDGSRIAVSMVGYMRALGVRGVLGAAKQATDCTAAMDGKGWAVPVHWIRKAAARDPEIRARLFRHEQLIADQVNRWAACGPKHSASQRVATFLHRMMMQSGGRELLATQDQLAEFLCLRRPTLSNIASRFRDKGLIDYRRGRIRIDSETELTSAACECCSALRAIDARVFDSTSGGQRQAPSSVAELPRA